VIEKVEQTVELSPQGSSKRVELATPQGRGRQADRPAGVLDKREEPKSP